ncbi:MAG: VOC family protein [Caldilineaceae bacterium]
MLSKPTRPGFHTVTPYLIVRELEPMVNFLKQAFGATEHFRAKGSGGGTHTELRIGDSMIMIGGGEGSKVREPMSTMIFLYLEDVDGVYQTALAAGATSLMEPTDGAFGEPRGAGIQDISGNQWYFANWQDRPDAPPAYREPDTQHTPTTTTTSDTIPMLSYEDGPAAMDWLATAFGFQEITRWLDDDGRLAHGEMITGSGRIMLATPTPAYESPKHHRAYCAAARAWSEAPWVINGVLVYVDDVDAHYAKAKAAGATLLGELEDGFPGRRYRVEDLEGHRWMFMQRG